MNERDDRPRPHAAKTQDDPVPEPLRAGIEGWKRSTPAPPAHLEARIHAAVQAQVTAGSVAAATEAPPAPALPLPRRGRRPLPWARAALRRSPARWGAAAAAAVLLATATLSLTGVLPWGRTPATRHILVADALRAAEQAEREHAAAIAQLEAAAQPILQRVDDRELPPAQVALLLSYRDRLRAVDSAIAEISGILEQNAGHAGARTYLLAAYMDKTRLLRDVLALQLPTQPGQEGKS